MLSPVYSGRVAASNAAPLLRTSASAASLIHLNKYPLRTVQGVPVQIHHSTSTLHMSVPVEGGHLQRDRSYSSDLRLECLLESVGLTLDTPDPDESRDTVPALERTSIRRCQSECRMEALEDTRRANSEMPHSGMKRRSLSTSNLEESGIVRN